MQHADRQRRFPECQHVLALLRNARRFVRAPPGVREMAEIRERPAQAAQGRDVWIAEPFPERSVRQALDRRVEVGTPLVVRAARQIRHPELEMSLGHEAWLLGLPAE